MVTACPVRRRRIFRGKSTDAESEHTNYNRQWNFCLLHSGICNPRLERLQWLHRRWHSLCVQRGVGTETPATVVLLRHRPRSMQYRIAKQTKSELAASANLHLQVFVIIQKNWVRSAKRTKPLLHFKIVLLPYSISDDFPDSPVQPRGSAGFVAIELGQLR